MKMPLICRLCAALKKIENFVYLTDPCLNLPVKIEVCCQLSILEDEGLPQSVCTECVEQLDACFKFITKVHDAQESLSKIFHSDGSTSGSADTQTVADKIRDCLMKAEPTEEPSASTSTAEELVLKSEDYGEEVEAEIWQTDKVKVRVTKVQIMHEDPLLDSAPEGKETMKENEENYDEQIFEIAEVHLDDNDESDQISEGEEMIIVQQNEIEQEQEIETIEVQTATEAPVESIKIDDKETWLSYPWICIACSIVCSSHLELREHFTAQHTGEIKYVCADCCKTHDKYYAFLNHVRLRHREHLVLGCDICGQNCGNFSDLVQHRTEQHSESERIETFVMCKECGKAFKNLSALQVHSKCHQPDDVKYRFACNLCGKKFGSKPNLKAHQKIHTGLKEFVCDQCGKGFTQKSNLEEHLLIHVSDAPYACTECERSFKTPARLARHKFVHTGIKPYKCEECGRAFREKDTLKTHKRVHTGAMPYECGFCGKHFRFKSVLSTHRHQHTGERPYSCLECNHHFTNWPNYNKHMKRRHGIDTSSSKGKRQTNRARVEVAKLNAEMSSAADSSSDLVTLAAEIPNLVPNDDIATGGSPAL